MFLIFLASDAKKCRAYGRGIQPKGVRTGDVAEFRVITKDAGEGAMKATVTGPGKFPSLIGFSFKRLLQMDRKSLAVSRKQIIQHMNVVMSLIVLDHIPLILLMVVLIYPRVHFQLWLDLIKNHVFVLLDLVSKVVLWVIRLISLSKLMAKQVH